MKHTLTLLLCHVTVAAGLFLPASRLAAAEKAPAPAASPPAGPVADAEIRRVLDLLFSTRVARLSLVNKSAASSYQFTVRMAPVAGAAAGVKPFTPTITTMTATPQRLAIVMRQADGLPVIFMSRNFFVGIDRQNPGGLIYFEGGNVLARFSQQGEPAENRFGLDLGFHDSIKVSDIDFNPGGAFRAILPRAQKVEFDRATRTLKLNLDRGAVVTVGVLPESDTNPFGIDRLIVANASLSMSFENFKLADQVAAKIPTLTKADLDKLGLPLRKPEVKELSQLNLMGPDDFGANPREKAAAEKLKTLLP